MRLFLILILTICYTKANAQNDIFKSSMNAADAAQFSSYFDDKLELTTPDLKGIYSKQQAKIIITKFFEKCSPKSYTFKHNGGSESRALYEIGKLEGANHSYRTYILYKLVQDKPQIIELRIEKE